MQPVYGAGQSVALSFDDGFDARTQSQAPEWNTAILDSLSKVGLKTIFYVTGSRIDSPEGLTLVSAWGAAGHSVANHTYSHFSQIKYH